MLAWVWWLSWPQDHQATKRIAEQEGDARSSSNQGPVAVALVVLSILTVILLWSLVNTVFALRYARLHYVDEDGGHRLQPGGATRLQRLRPRRVHPSECPAVSETVPTNSRIRKTALGHALLSYLFGTGILAVAINLGQS